MRKFWLITGVHSPHWIQNIKENYTRCSGKNTELIVVENGKGIGLWTKSNLGEHVIQSKPGAANYINAGIQYAKKYAGPDDWFLKFDSDDYYGKNRIKQVQELSEKGALACGATSIFIRTESNKLYFLDSKTKAFEILSAPFTPHGPTLGAALRVTLPFIQPTEPWGEDALWVSNMRKSGIEFYSLDLDGFAYIRHTTGTHTFPVPEGLVRHLWFMDVYDIGEWNIDVVEGLVKPEKMELVPYSGIGTHEACEHLLNVAMENMQIHKLKKKDTETLEQLVSEQKEIERATGALQLKILAAQRELSGMLERHNAVTKKIQHIGNEIAEEFGALAVAGRIVLQRGVFVEGVPSAVTDDALISAIDDFDRTHTI